MKGYLKTAPEGIRMTENRVSRTRFVGAAYALTCLCSPQDTKYWKSVHSTGQTIIQETGPYESRPSGNG